MVPMLRATTCTVFRMASAEDGILPASVRVVPAPVPTPYTISHTVLAVQMRQAPGPGPAAALKLYFKVATWVVLDRRA